MKSSLSSLLEKAGIDTSDRGFWRRVVVLHNIGMLPAQRLDESDVVMARGFNVLLLDRRGQPTHFCKCRPPTDEWVKQTELRSRMSMEPSLRQIIPFAWAVGSADVHMSISAYVPGRLFTSNIRGMSPHELKRALREILEAMDAVSRCGAQIDPSAFAGQIQIDLTAASEWAFDSLPPSLLPPAQADTVREALARGGVVRRVLQHGDLWPQNILRHDGHWWLLDFELFGQIQVPMYDALHLVHSCWTMRPNNAHRVRRWVQRLLPAKKESSSWIDDLRMRGTATRPWWVNTLTWARTLHGLTRAQTVGVLGYYLVDMAARMYRRQVRMEYVAPYVLGLRTFADRLAAGETFAAAFGESA